MPAPKSARSTTSGSSTRQSRRSRRRAPRRGTRRRPRAGGRGRRPASARRRPDAAARPAGQLPRRRRASGRPSARSPRTGRSNMSCSTKASRSAGVSVSSTTSRASPTESASSASCSGSSRRRRGRRSGREGATTERFLAPHAARAQHVQADPRDDGGQPAAEVLDLVRVGAAEPQPGLLHGVVGLGHRAQHPVGDRPQARPVLLEPLGQPVLLAHPVTSSALAAGHTHERTRCETRRDVTGEHDEEGTHHASLRCRSERCARSRLVPQLIEPVTR